MNIDIEYYHARAFRLTTFTTYAELYDLATDANVRVAPADLPTVRGLSADGMRALIEAGRLSVPLAPTDLQHAKEMAIGDIWLTRRGTYSAITYGEYTPADGRLRMTVVELYGRAPTVYEVDHTGGFIGRGNGEHHPLDLVKRDRGFL